MRVARDVDDPDTLGYVLANHMWDDMSASQGLDMAHEQLRLAHRSGDKFAELRAHATLATYKLMLGDRDGFDGSVQEEGRLEHELRIRDYWTGLHRALQARMAGRFDEAEGIAVRSFSELQRDAADNARQGLGAVILDLRRHLGRLREVEPELKANVERYESVSTYRAILALAYAIRPDGRDDAAALCEGLAQRDFDDLPSDALLRVTLAALADVCWCLGEERRASLLYARLLPRAQECVIIGFANASSGPVSRSLAILATTMRRWDEAEHHFEHAVSMNTRLGDQPWLAHSRLQYADMLLRRNEAGDRDRAIALLNGALEFAKESGMRKVQSDAEGLLSSLT
jgi:tetratricopeptide (TPR) repeat protein